MYLRSTFIIIHLCWVIVADRDDNAALLKIHAVFRGEKKNQMINLAADDV